VHRSGTPIPCVHPLLFSVEAKFEMAHLELGSALVPRTYPQGCPRYDSRRARARVESRLPHTLIASDPLALSMLEPICLLRMLHEVGRSWFCFENHVRATVWIIAMDV
jgi:hypothetical protein